MNDGHPAEGDERLFSSLFKLIAGKGKREADVTEEDIMDMVNEGHEQGMLKENEAEMISNIFDFGEKEAQDVMTHRKNIVAIDSESTIEEVFHSVITENFSRYPVYDGEIDNIVGILHIRDFFRVYVDEKNRDKKLQEIQNGLLFEAYCIPETRNISLLFKEMQSKKIHIAVVVDEYGQTAGIVTMEDILEEIVGNIMDEYDDEEEMICVQPDGSYLMDGQALLEDIEELLDISFTCEDIDTINGYMIYKLGKIPAENEHFETECNGYLFRVLTVKNKMISKVHAIRVADKDTSDNRTENGGKNEQL